VRVAELKKIEKELGAFVEDFAPELGRSERRYWCKLYLTGLLLDGERKSIEPMAERAPGGNEQALQQFVNQSPWARESIQEKLSRRLVRCSGQATGGLVLDDTTLPKKGESSVGVARQYCGALGKVTNCQAIVTWHYCVPHAHFPLLAQGIKLSHKVIASEAKQSLFLQEIASSLTLLAMTAPPFLIETC